MLRFKAIEPALITRLAYPFEDGRDGVFNPFVCHFGSSTKDVTSTNTNTAAPWTPQQQSLETGFNTAGNLLSQPAPAQTYPIAPLNSTQTTALQGITNQATAGTPITGAANTFDTSLENGQYLNSNPSLSYFQQLAGSNLGLSNPGATALQGLSTGTGAGESTLQNYASGANLNSNPYQDQTAQSIEAQVIPQVASAFNNGNNVNNPAMAYAAANGVTAALAPVEYGNYQTQEGLQTGAANILAGNANTASSALTNSALGGGNLQATAAQGISQPYQSTLNNMVQGNLAAPSDQALSYADLDQMLGAGTTQQQQAQNVLTGGANTTYSSAESPYAQLAAYMQAVGGNYGGTTSGTATTPYFTNTAASDISGLTGISSLLGGSSGISSIGSALGSLGSTSIAGDAGMEGVADAGASIGGSIAGAGGIADALSSLFAFL